MMDWGETLPASNIAESGAGGKAEPQIVLSLQEKWADIMLEEQRAPVLNEHLYDTASYFKPVSKSWSQRKRNLTQQRLPFSDDDELVIDFDEHGLEYEIASLLSTLPGNIWGPFDSLDKEVFKTVVEAAADFVYLAYPKEILCSLTNDQFINDSNTQLNHLWEQVVNFAKQGPSLQQVYCFIARLIRENAHEYSLLTETHVFTMLHMYSLQLENNHFKLPYVSGSPNPQFSPVKANATLDPLFSRIIEVVDKMNFDRNMTDDDYCASLMVSIIKERDKEWLLPLSVDDTETIYLKRPHLQSSSTELMNILIDVVHGELMNRLSDAVRPVKLVFCQDFDCFQLSPEIPDLIKVAELHRLALGSRFIKRSNLLWAFHECGHCLPRGIIIHPSAHECRPPPYHIYQTSLKLAELFGDKLRLENFIYTILYWKDNECDESNMVAMQEDYKTFLEALRHGNSDLGGPIFIKAFPDILRDTGLQFNFGTGL